MKPESIMKPEELRRHLNEVHGSDAIPPEALEAYAALVATFNETIRKAAQRLEPEDEPSGFVALIEELGQDGGNDR